MLAAPSQLPSTGVPGRGAEAWDQPPKVPATPCPRAVAQVRGTLGGMPAAQRSALEMAYFEGLTHTEIAAKTGEPLGTIKTRIRAGLMALRKGFEA